MGDRGNIVMEYGEGQRVYLYTHWGGSELPLVLAEALDSEAGRSRWDDDAYLARIIFCAMVGPGQWDSPTGYGISTSPPDNEHDFLVVNPRLGMVRIEAENGDGDKLAMSFEEYIAHVRAAVS